MIPISFRRLLLLGGLWLAWGGTLLFGQGARDRAVELTAVVQQSPPTITLQWNTTGYTVTGQKVFRRLKNAAVWSEIATPANAATSYADTDVSVGVNYEYYVARVLSNGPLTADGYVASGIRVPVVIERGRVILLVDDTMATPLATELARLSSDLTGDGWLVIRQDVSRTAAPTSIRATIQSIYLADPANTVALILFGHIPVPYSGYRAVDGHPDHVGAWPSDVYYGEIDGTWTDTTVDTTLDAYPEPPRNTNVPGDGKFDQTIIPSEIDLQVGRIDLADMPSFGVGETELLRRYLDRDHAYRHKLGAFASIGRRGLIDDTFQFFSGEAFAASGWRSFTACVGAGNVDELDWFGTLQTQSYLWAYGCGPGWFGGAGGVGSTSDFATKDSLAVFTMLFGSYFGDWDNSDAFLRSPLAGTASSLGLISCWSGRPHWFFHPMALGETTGYCARITQNNRNTPQLGYDANYGALSNHIALLGDPTLRLYPVTPPTNLAESITANAVTLTWSASTDAGIEGYLITRAGSAVGPFVPLQSGLATGTTFVDRTVTPGASYTYLVRAVKAETSPTGSYSNPSQGVFGTPVTADTASGPEINLSLSGSGNPITAGDTGPLAANGTDFGSVELPGSVTRTFTIANVGTTALNVSGANITGANPADFALVQAPPSSLAAGGHANFQIRFQPSATGDRSAVFTLTSDDADEGSYQFVIAGKGLPAHAEIAIYPPALNRSIHAGTAVTETVNLSNPAAGTLAYTISSTLARYGARDSDSFGGPYYGWVEISATGTEIGGWTNADDLISEPIALGFDFPFYGNSFSAVRVCTNGYLSFTDTNTNAGNTPLPSTSAAANMIAALWSDLVIGAGSHVYWQTIDGKFIVQFENVTLYEDTSAHLTFEAILQPSGEILFQYKTLTAFGSGYTIGLQNGLRDDGLLIAYNASYVHPGLAIRIRPPGLESWLSLTASSGTVPPAGAQSIGATLDAAGLAPGNYYAELIVASNARGQESVIIPVRFTVGNTPVENWRLLHFGSMADSGDAADTANVDGDAGSNLLEYALSRDPWIPETTVFTTTAINGSGYLQIQFERNATRTDLRYIVEATSDLTAAWTQIAAGIHGAPAIATGAHSCTETGTGDIRTVTVEDSALATAFANRFLRLRVMRD